jgi:hypothetical protein
MTACLYELAAAKSDFTWIEEVHGHAFEQMKTILTSAPVLCFPSAEGRFILDTDASEKAVAAELTQIQDGQEKVICYASAVLTKEQKNYCTTRKELLAVVKFCRYFRHYLLGRKFTLRTDHASLVWLLRFRHLEGQLARWLEEMSQFDMEVVHRPGKKHLNADGLSRIPDIMVECDCYQAGSKLEDLPCGGCTFCSRAHNQWSRFHEDVDDVIPLAVRQVETVMFEVKQVYSQSDEQVDSPEVNPETATEIHEGNWFNSYTSDKIRDLQLSDHDLRPVMLWMEDGVSPTQHELFLMSPATKYLWLCKSQLRLRDGVLYYAWENSPGQHLVLVVPKDLRPEVLHLCHDIRSAGHLGQQKTLLRLKRSFLWYRMAVDCKLYVASCQVCNQSKKANRKARAPLGSYHAGYPMERVHLDILGPFHPSASGNVYILMMVDQFTKWVEMVALPNQSAHRVAQEFLQRFVVTFGCPLEIHTDQGRNFDSNLFKAFCQLLEVTKTRTTPYHPSGNGQVERYNRIVLAMVRGYCLKKNKNWDRDLPLLCMALHSMENRQTGFTPNMMMLGREVIQPAELIMGLTQTNLHKYEPYEWVQHLAETIPAIHQQARSNLKTTQHRQKRDYDLRIMEQKFLPGDVVYRYNSATKVGESKKLQAIWLGPFLVLEAKSPLYKIRGIRKEYWVHHNDLKSCCDRIFPLWLRRLRHRFFEKECATMTGEEAPQEDVPQEDVPQEDVPQEDVPQEDDEVEPDQSSDEEAQEMQDGLSTEGSFPNNPGVPPIVDEEEMKWEYEDAIPWLEGEDLQQLFSEEGLKPTNRPIRKKERPVRFKDYVDIDEI